MNKVFNTVPEIRGVTDIGLGKPPPERLEAAVQVHEVDHLPDLEIDSPLDGSRLVPRQPVRPGILDSRLASGVVRAHTPSPLRSGNKLLLLESIHDAVGIMVPFSSVAATGTNKSPVSRDKPHHSQEIGAITRSGHGCVRPVVIVIPYACYLYRATLPGNRSSYLGPGLWYLPLYNSLTN